jgi:heat-inducible transcriptional repressor
MNGPSSLNHMNPRAQHILRQLIDTYLNTGEPVGSRTISKLIEANLSPATIRNIMSDLEDGGFLFAPHTSAGRMPTAAGLRFFVDTLLEHRELTREERNAIESHCETSQRSASHILEQATRALSGLSSCAGFVLAPSIAPTIKHIEFVAIGTGRALLILVDHDDQVENRVIDLPAGVPASSLQQATNYLLARSQGKTLPDVRDAIATEIAAGKSELDEISTRIVAAGLAAWDEGQNQLIVRGQAHLLDDVRAMQDIERIRKLFALLEQQDTVLRLLEMAQDAQGVQIFIGSEHEFFSGTGCSMVITQMQGKGNKITGALGVIGPTRLNYGRIVPLVDYTAAVVGKLLG